MVPYAKMQIFDAPNASNAVGVAVPLKFSTRSDPSPVIKSQLNLHPPGPINIWPVTRPMLAINHTQAKITQMNVLYFYRALLEHDSLALPL